MDLLEQAVFDGVMDCPECGNRLEPDCPECECGWKNTILGMGMI